MRRRTIRTRAGLNRPRGGPRGEVPKTLDGITADGLPKVFYLSIFRPHKHRGRADECRSLMIAVVDTGQGQRCAGLGQRRHNDHRRLP